MQSNLYCPKNGKHWKFETRRGATSGFLNALNSHENCKIVKNSRQTTAEMNSVLNISATTVFYRPDGVAPGFSYVWRNCNKRFARQLVIAAEQAVCAGLTIGQLSARTWYDIDSHGVMVSYKGDNKFTQHLHLLWRLTASSTWDREQSC